MKNIVILGSTGKIGCQALEVIRSYPREFKVVGLACRHQSKKFAEQVKEFNPKITAIRVEDGEEKFLKAASCPEADLVVVAVVGLAGLKPTLAAIRAGKDVALATKEVMVVAGKLVMEKVRQAGINLIPIDSEHSALFQCLRAADKKEIKRLVLTMGKGPIAGMSENRLKNVTMKDVLDRPNWEMGRKIAVDSATGMNKTFEVIEARFLFGVEAEQIEIIVHPEYLCHSLVEFVDGSILTELGSPDMKRYLQYALFYPKRKLTKVSSFIDLTKQSLTFENPPYRKFPCLNLGFQALERGSSAPAVIHGADKTAVKAFVSGKIGFTQISQIVTEAMKKHKPISNPSLEQLIQVERWGQDYAQRLIQ